MASGAAAADDWSFAPDEFEPIYLSTGEDGRAMVQRGDVPDLLSDPFVDSALREWRRYRRFGLAHGASGWANERRLYVRVLEVAESEYEFVSAREREERMKRGRK